MTRDEARVYLAQNPRCNIVNSDGCIYTMTEDGNTVFRSIEGDWKPGALYKRSTPYRAVAPAPALPSLGPELEAYLADAHMSPELKKRYALILARALELCAEQTREQIRETEIVSEYRSNLLDAGVCQVQTLRPKERP